MRLFLTLLLLCTLVVPAPVRAGDLATLRVAVPERQPYFFRVQGEPAGLEADLLSELAESLQLALVFVPCDTDQCLEMVEEGRADLGAGVAEVPGLSGRLLFVRPAYALRSNTVFYRLRETAPVRDQRRLRGKKLGVRRNAPLPPEIASDHLIPRIEQNSAARLIKLLLAGAVDLVMLEEAEGDSVLRSLHLERRITKCQYRLPGGEPLFFAFSLHSKQLSRAGQLENQLRDMVDSGRLKGLQQLYLNNEETP
ncbi:MAG: substrate-binding periplasmic protein [Desulfovibrio sp.]